MLSNNKGINRQGGGLTAPALTAKDMDDIKTAVAHRRRLRRGVVPQEQGRHVHGAAARCARAGSQALLIAKIERAEAIPALEEIIDASDGIMVARGDLAMEVGNAAVPGLQKRMIRLARERNKLTITATQMMESMILQPGADARRSVRRRQRGARRHRRGDAVGGDRRGQLSGRDHRNDGQICIEAEKSNVVELDRDFLDRTFTRIDQSIAMARAVHGVSTSGSRRSSR